MEIKRTPFQGVVNIIRFNWHFYGIALLVLIVLFFFKNLVPSSLHLWLVFGVGLTFISILISLAASFYVYDFSGLYKLSWLDNYNITACFQILNINAGFDETSCIIEDKFQNAEIIICDFYNPDRHTEVSIKRARKAYPPHPRTITVLTNKLPFANDHFDMTIAILSAHEIRNKKERIQFFKELNRITKSTGEIFVTEHLRDLNNFLAYTIGFLHFYSRSNWLNTFNQANLIVKKEMKTTPFLTTFILKPNGNTF